METQTGNRLLDSLSLPCRERLLSAARLVELPVGSPLFLRDELPRFVYFLVSGIGSVVFISEQGTSIELTTQGSEGIISWSALLGPAAAPSECTVQVRGAGFRLPLGSMRRAFDTSAEVRQRVLEYVQHQGIVANQIVACNRLHRAEARFARWLLTIADRTGSDDLSMTQEFLSNLLGTRRTTVAEVCAHLSRAGALEGRRGGLRIVDRKALERHACECYGILRARFDTLYCRPLMAPEE